MNFYAAKYKTCIGGAANEFIICTLRDICIICDTSGRNISTVVKYLF